MSIDSFVVFDALTLFGSCAALLVRGSHQTAKTIQMLRRIVVRLMMISPVASLGFLPLFVVTPTFEMFRMVIIGKNDAFRWKMMRGVAIIVKMSGKDGHWNQAVGN